MAFYFIFMFCIDHFMNLKSTLPTVGGISFAQGKIEKAHGCMYPDIRRDDANLPLREFHDRVTRKNLVASDF